MKHLLTALSLSCLLGAQAQSAPLEFRYGVDVFTKTQVRLDAFQSITAMREIAPGLHFGHSLYASSAGNAGGLFVGGFDLIKRWQIGNKTQLEFGGFIGGGGGSALVSGNGLMTRASVNFRRHLFGNVSGTLGVSYIQISGSPIASSALSFGLSRDTDFAFMGGHVDNGVDTGRVILAVKPMIKQFYTSGNKTRGGRALNTMTLIGVEASFANAPNARNETFLQAMGAVDGDGEGYADVQVGYRWKTAPTGLRAFGEIAVGVGGGGDVDTGGGLLATVGVGAAIPIARGFELEFGAQATTALNGDLDAISPYVRTSLIFGAKNRPYQTPHRWQLGFGLSLQSPNEGFRKPGHTATGSPVLLETSIDLFLGKHLYLTGNAQTAGAGQAGGYQVGLMGLGYEFPLNNRWTISAEAMVGAAGGAGIDTRGGLMAAGKLELDYAFNDRLSLSAGIGKLSTIRDSGGAKPVTFHLGLKSRFTTFH